jgi:hypothetical protein
MDVRVKENFDGMNMATYIHRMEDKLHRAAQRKVVGKQATELAKEIRKQIKLRNMPYSRSRTRESRRLARERGQKPLVKTIKTKTWNVRRRGIIGKIVGSEWPAGNHSHLVERGFTHNKSGWQTVAHRYQEEAEHNFRKRANDIAIEGFKEWLRKQRSKGKATR